MNILIITILFLALLLLVVERTFPKAGNKKFWKIMSNSEDAKELNKAIDLERKQQKAKLNGEPPVVDIEGKNKYVVERTNKLPGETY